LSSTKSEHVAENKATFSQSFVDILWEPYKLCTTNVHDVQLADRSTLHWRYSTYIRWKETWICEQL